MALFNSISKKASQAGQNALQKAKDLSEIARISALISDTEKEVNSTYFQIGKLYATLYRDNPEQEFLSMVSLITEAETRIENYRRQIQDIKGVQRCPACGGEVSKGSAFCNLCGAAIPAVEVLKMEGEIQCRNCGAILKQGLRFCTSCGTPVLQPIEEQEDSSQMCVGQEESMNSNQK